MGAGGALTPKSPPTVGAGDNPNGVAVSSDGTSVYVTTAGDPPAIPGYVSQYDVGPGGTLTPKSTPTVTAGFNPVRVAVSPRPPVPIRKDQCKHGGWKAYAGFKNQGDCIRFVIHQATKACVSERAAIGIGRFGLFATLRCIHQRAGG